MANAITTNLLRIISSKTDHQNYPMIQINLLKFTVILMTLYNLKTLADMAGNFQFLPTSIISMYHLHYQYLKVLSVIIIIINKTNVNFVYT